MRKLNLNNVKLRDKLLLMYVLSVFIPIVMTNVVFYNVTTSNIRNQKIRDSGLALESVKGYLKTNIDNTAGVSYSFYADRTFNETLARRFTSTSEFVEAQESLLRGALTSLEKSVQPSMNIKVYTDNPTILTGSVEPLTDEIRSSDWYKQLQALSTPYPMLVSTGDSLSMVQKLNNYYTNGFNQTIKIDMNMQIFKEYFHNNSFDGKVYLIDPEGLVQYSNDPDIDWTSSPLLFKDIPLPQKAVLIDTPYSGINYLEGWKLQGVMNNEVVLEEVRKSRSFVILLACINFFVPSAIIAFISRSLHVRLVQLLRYMKKVKNQNFQTIPHEEARDEIGQLTNEFNKMTERINDLINHVYIANIQRKDLELKQQQAQLHALYSQINPHFLFNALESIRMQSVIKGEDETSNTIHNMAKMFRKSISWSRDWITVSEELDVINSFLEIQKYRFADELEYDIQVDEEAKSCLIPNMIFLPFVENASVHGVEPAPDKGFIQLRISLEEDKLIFVLKDNGVGIPSSRLEEIKLYLSQDDVMGDRIGMKNTCQRLKLFYQDRFSFSIQSEEGEGTCIRIALPLHRENE